MNTIGLKIKLMNTILGTRKILIPHSYTRWQSYTEFLNILSVAARGKESEITMFE